MAEKCKIGEKHMKDLKEHTDNVSSRNENTTFNLLGISERMKGLYNRVRTRIVNAPDQRKYGDKLISDIIREEMKGSEAERAEIIIKFMALFNQDELLAAKLKDFYYLEISRLSKQFFLSRDETNRVISPDKNIVLENLPMPVLKVLYGETVAFLNVENSILNPFSKTHKGKEKGYIKGWIGKRVLRIGTPFRNKYRDLTGGLIVMTEASMNYVSEVAKNIVQYMQAPISKTTKRNYGFDDIFRMVKRLADLVPSQPNGYITIVRLFNMRMHGRAFVGKDGQFYVHTKWAPVTKDDGENVYYYVSGDVMFNWSDPVPASEFWESEYPAETNITFTPSMMIKFDKEVERARKLYSEIFDNHQKQAQLQKRDLLIEFAKFFPPGVDAKDVAKILFEEEGMEMLDSKQRADIQFLKDNFLQYGIFEVFLDQGHVPDPARKKNQNAWPTRFPDHSFMLNWTLEIARLESELEVALAENNPKDIKNAKAKLRYYNKQFDRMTGSNVDSQGGSRVMPRSTAMFMKRITNAFSHTNARTDESVIYDYLRHNATILARNDLIIKMLRAWRMANGNKLVQDEIMETWKTTMHLPDVKSTGISGIPYSVESVTRFINRIGIGRFKLNISTRFIDRIFRSASNYLTGAKLGGRTTAVKNSTAIAQKTMMYSWKTVQDAMRIYNEHQDLFDSMISRSGALSYGDFFSKGLVSNLSGDHELDRENTWRVVQIYFKYFKESKMAQKKKGGMTEAKAQANLQERLGVPLQYIPSLQNLKKINRELYSKRLLEMTAKFANRAITLEYKNLKHVDSIPDALIWKVQNMMEFSNEFQLHAAGMPTMGGTEGSLRSLSFVMGVLKLQEMGHIRTAIDELTGTQLSDAIRFGRIYAEFLDFALSQQGVGAASRGAVGSFLNRFKFWMQQKFGWDLRVLKYGYESFKSLEHLSNQTMDWSALAKTAKTVVTHAYKPTKIRALMADNPQAAALINFITLVGPLTVLMDIVFAGPVMGRALKRFMPAYRENRSMYSLATGMGSNLITLVISLPWILGASLAHADWDDGVEEWLETMIRNTWVGAGGMFIEDLFMYLVWYRITDAEDEKIQERGMKLLETISPFPGGRIRAFNRWKENVAKAMD